jgi:hypothetical protein
MPATPLDVWFVSAEQVYRGVPFQVAAGWVEQGRLAGTDKVRPTKTSDPWVTVGEHPLLADYLLRPAGVKAVAAGTAAVAPLEPPEPEGLRRANDDDDDVDMIPLIDVSLVLLVFFMLIGTGAAMASFANAPEADFGKLLVE